MKTSIFNMTFVLPPMVEMTQVEKDMPTGSGMTWLGPFRPGTCCGQYC